MTHELDPDTKITGPYPPDDAWRYRLIFKTTVEAIDRPLRIVGFGMFAWDEVRRVIPDADSPLNGGVFSARTSRDWYLTDDGIVAPGRPCVDPENWAGTQSIGSIRQRWFLVGEDDEVDSFKGEAVLQFGD